MDRSRQCEGLLVDYREPEELERIMDFSLPENGVGAEGIFPTIEQTLQHSVNTFSPRFMDKLYAGSNPIGVLSELLLAGLNGNSHVYHVSPVFTLMEIHVTRALARLFGFKGELAGGLSCPGGSASNQLAMVTARNSLFPEIKGTGYFPKPSVVEVQEMERQGYPPALIERISNSRGSTYGKLIAFTSSAGHYSLEKSAVIMGLGTENIVGVPCDSYGAMIPSELERLVQEHIACGHSPFFVNVTAGTTVLGAFDPIRPCAEIARKYNMWLHVDGSWGGCTVFVPELARTLLDGTELAQSITLNPHKMLQTPLQCSLLLVPDSSIFPRANALKANYLFHGQSHDLGDGTLGCGRRSDAIKLFIGWKYYGKLGYQRRIEKSLSNVRRFVELLHQDDMQAHRIQMLRLGSDDHQLEEQLAKEKLQQQQEQEDESNNNNTHPRRDKTQPSLLQICFWYRPRGSRKIDWRGTERLWKRSVDSLQQVDTLPPKSARAIQIQDVDSAAVTPLLVPGQSGSPKESHIQTPSAAAGSTVESATISRCSSTASLTSVASQASSATTVSTTSVPTITSTNFKSAAAPTSEEHELSEQGEGIILVNPQDRQDAKAWMESVTKAVHARVRVRGGFMIDYAPLGAYLPVFFRVVLNPPTIRELDLIKLIEEILECGEAVADSLPIPECCRAT
ncbi:hypothetical protein BGZ83_010732 [Gryganskiella cystojenkinii]|nr:hypothetical protein BGZ83_010732 [Gryganskiella cystojenkinii]